MGSRQKKIKLSLKNEVESEDVDVPSEVEGSNSDSGEEEMEDETEELPAQKRKKLSPRSKNQNDRGESNDYPADKRSRTNNSNSEDEQPAKRIKLNLNSSYENNQNNGESCGERQNLEEEANNECNDENITSNFYAEELTSDDEILTFQCPQNFDVRTLLNKTINLSKDTKLRDGVSKYVCQTMQNSNDKKLNIVVPSNKNGTVFLKLPVAGHLLLRQVLKMPKGVSSFVEPDSKNVQLPMVDFMKRHPLLGTEWSNHFEKVKRQIKKQKKLLRKSLKHEQSLEKAEQERKWQKKKLKSELALLKKKQIFDVDT